MTDTPLQVVLRQAAPEEVEGLAELVVNSYREFASGMASEQWEQMAANLRGLTRAAPIHGLMVAELGGAVAGTISYHSPGAERGVVGFTRFPPEWALMRILAVDPACRGHGVGMALARRCVERARQDGASTIGLHTSELMTSARRIYDRLGFCLQEEFEHLGLCYGVYTLTLRG